MFPQLTAAYQNISAHTHTHMHARSQIQEVRAPTPLRLLRLTGAEQRVATSCRKAPGRGGERGGRGSGGRKCGGEGGARVERGAQRRGRRCRSAVVMVVVMILLPPLSVLAPSRTARAVAALLVAMVPPLTGQQRGRGLVFRAGLL